MNYNEEMKKIVNTFENKKKILLHSCCAPCSSEVITRLLPYFNITIYYYNPNIEPYEEYKKRKEEQIRFIKEINKDVSFIDCDYDNEKYREIIKGNELDLEGGIRCEKCIKHRMINTMEIALKNGFEYFGTTLTVSPHKNSKYINETGINISENKNIKYLVSDFKKEEGYKNSIELSKKYNLYRQNYCGCIFSKRINYED